MVVTLWYRAPEILLGGEDGQYGPEIDVWSLGCILFEMATGSALFPAESEIGTLMAIFRVLGTPTEATWPGVAEYADYSATFPRFDGMGIDGTASQPPSGHFEPEMLALLYRMLTPDPAQRISAAAAEADPYFDAS